MAQRTNTPIPYAQMIRDLAELLQVSVDRIDDYFNGDDDTEGGVDSIWSDHLLRMILAAMTYGGLEEEHVWPDGLAPFGDDENDEVLCRAVLYGREAVLYVGRPARDRGKPLNEFGERLIEGLRKGGRALREEAEYCAADDGKPWQRYFTEAIDSAIGPRYLGDLVGKRHGPKAAKGASRKKVPVAQLEGPALFAAKLGGTLWAWGIWFDGDDHGMAPRSARKRRVAEREVERAVFNAVDAIAVEVDSGHSTANICTTLEESARLGTFIEVFCNPKRPQQSNAAGVWRGEMDVMANAFGVSTAKFTAVLARNGGRS